MERLDHILIRVEDLEKSVNAFRRAGFRVYFGSKPAESYNAMIYFQDNSFIELVDTTKFPLLLTFLAKTKIINLFGAFYKRIGMYALSKDTILDYAVYSRDIEKHYNKIRAKASKLHCLKRVDSLGRALKWKLFVLKTRCLPFVMSDYCPCKYPEYNACHHKNNTLGIDQICIGTTMNLQKLKQEILNTFDVLEESLLLKDDVLEVATQNSVLKYKKGTRDKILGIQFNNLSPSVEMLLSEYRILNT